MNILNNIPYFAPDDAGTGTTDAAEVTVAEPETEQPSKESTEEKKSEKATTPEVEELDIEGLEKTDDGYTYTLGNSIYKGSSFREVMAKARKGAEEKDKASLELDRSLRELRAKKAIHDPEELDEEEEIKAPSETEIYAAVFSGKGVEPRMMYWDDDKWLAYGEENSLRDFQLNRKMELVNKLKEEAINRLNAVTATWLNRTSLRADITPAIQRMVAASGLDPEQFGPVYLQILQDKQYRGADGLLSSAKIIEAMHNEIIKSVKPARESALEKKTAEEKAKLQEKKKNLGSGSTSVKPKVNDKAPPNIAEASRRALALLR